ncbi:probable RNA methyltransferase CG11342 [Aricia agestis]|uniref:probable RNA methyltransferase CG11342 n=1 Tax=Aricia agestis TaxID=91739 RepID=UPI001C204925|nr:probable RNA methyltransferase CG11342 [Aricia agestis]
MEDLTFSGNDPGAVRFGNFINYYSFHSTDERIKNLNPKMFPSANDSTVICLDIGCNTGELTNSLKHYLQKLHSHAVIKILAIDIDDCLIERAKESNGNEDTTYMALDIMHEASSDILKEFLQNSSKEYFDYIFCFSVTMWIHINHGDDGLLHFLELLKSIAKTIIIEPQPWKCYRNAQRRMKRAGNQFPLYETLKIRSNVDSVIEETLCRSHIKLCESSLSTWSRKVQSYNLIIKT